MSATETLIDRVNGQTIDQDDPNSIHRALKTEFVGRDNSGAPTPYQSLGTPLIPWGSAYITSLILDGSPIDPGLISAPRNRVVSGTVRSTSAFPAYLRPDRISAAEVTVLGATTPLVIDVNGVAAEITTDIVKSGLTTAPVLFNTCKINDIGLTGQDSTRFLGENGTSIPVDNMQTELTNKIGEFVALVNQTTNEILYCRIESATSLTHARRGFFVDESGDPLPADVLNNNDILRILSLGFVFAEDNGTTIDVTYNNPIVGGDEPASPQTGDYWYDLSLNVWKRYSGSTFDQIDRTYIGVVAISTVVCVGARPEYFGKSYRDNNTLKILLESKDVAVSDKADFIISVDGEDKRFDFGFFRWDAAADFESGFSRTVSRDYWLYVTEEGKPIISGYKPYDVRGFLRGWYHPYESWRAVAQVFNNASNDFELVNPSDETLESLVAPQIFNRIILSNNTTDPLHDIDSAEGTFLLDDGTAQYNAPAFTKLLDANWALGSGNGGSPGITLAAGATYHYFALINDNGSLIDFGMDTSLTASNLLAYGAVVSAGLTKISYQGSLVTDSAADIIPFTQIERWFYWRPRISDITAISFAGRLTISPWAAYVAITVPVDIKVRAKINVIVRSTAGPASLREAFFTDPDLSPGLNDPPSAPGANYYHFTAEGGDSRVAELDVVTDVLGQIKEQWFGGAIAGIYSLLTMGFENLQLREWNVFNK